ncbi:fungal-specific transcription factor domain-containing protein [Aspergillus insuetus]
MTRGRKRSASSANVDMDINVNIDDSARPPPRSVPRLYKPGSRSCEGCHQRKVRCDRTAPCTNCSRYGMTCVYPARNTDTDTGRKPPSLQDIHNCLKRLEILLSRFGESSQVATGSVVDGIGGRVGSEVPVQARPRAVVKAIGTRPSDKSSNKSTWEILLKNSDIEPLLQDESIGPETASAQPRANPVAHQKRDACAPSDRGSELLDVYPDTQIALRLWDVYVKSVDPVLKILHVPTVQSIVVTTILDPRSAQSSTLALTFAIYYAAVTALCHDDNDHPVDLSCDKTVLLKRYQTALDRLLLTPDLMSRPDLSGVQALTIYVTCLRAHEFGRRVWVLTGLAIRLAQSIGLHRDGTSLKLTPFETEMRLRLWWHLCVLDSRAPEDQGFMPMIDLGNQDLRLPLNVNDDQIYPGMTHYPVPSEGWTDMSFLAIQTEACRVILPILDAQQQQQQHSAEADADALGEIREKRKLLRDPGRYLAATYGISPGSEESQTGLQRIAAQHVLTACKKMEFVLQLREEICLQKKKKAPHGANETTPDVCKLSFKLACDALESSRVLLKGRLSSRFEWFFNMYTQWYALAYVLRCLRSRPFDGLEADRAWDLVEGLVPHEYEHKCGQGKVWRFLKLLRDQVWLLRQKPNVQLLSTATTGDTGARQPSSSGEGYYNSHLQFLPDPTRTTVAGYETSVLPEWDNGLMADPDGMLSSALDMFMPEISFLPDWNAVVNGQ